MLPLCNICGDDSNSGFHIECEDCSILNQLAVMQSISIPGLDIDVMHHCGGVRPGSLFDLQPLMKTEQLW